MKTSDLERLKEKYIEEKVDDKYKETVRKSFTSFIDYVDKNMKEGEEGEEEVFKDEEKDILKWGNKIKDNSDLITVEGKITKTTNKAILFKPEDMDSEVFFPKSICKPVHDITKDVINDNLPIETKLEFVKNIYSKNIVDKE